MRPVSAAVEVPGPQSVTRVSAPSASVTRASASGAPAVLDLAEGRQRQDRAVDRQAGDRDRRHPAAGDGGREHRDTDGDEHRPGWDHDRDEPANPPELVRRDARIGQVQRHRGQQRAQHRTGPFQPVAVPLPPDDQHQRRRTGHHPRRRQVVDQPVEAAPVDHHRAAHERDGVEQAEAGHPYDADGTGVAVGPAAEPGPSAPGREADQGADGHDADDRALQGLVAAPPDADQHVERARGVRPRLEDGERRDAAEGADEHDVRSPDPARHEEQHRPDHERRPEHEQRIETREDRQAEQAAGDDRGTCRLLPRPDAEPGDEQHPGQHLGGRIPRVPEVGDARPRQHDRAQAGPGLLPRRHEGRSEAADREQRDARQQRQQPQAEAAAGRARRGDRGGPEVESERLDPPRVDRLLEHARPGALTEGQQVAHRDRHLGDGLVVEDDVARPLHHRAGLHVDAGIAPAEHVGEGRRGQDQERRHQRQRGPARCARPGRDEIAYGRAVEQEPGQRDREHARDERERGERAEHAQGQRRRRGRGDAHGRPGRDHVGCDGGGGPPAEDEGSEQVERGQCDRLDEQVVQQRAGQPDDRL